MKLIHTFKVWYLLLLFGKIVLDLLHVQKLRAELESQWELITQDLSIALDLDGMSVFELTKSLGIFFLGLKQIFIPLLIEFLVLLDMSLFAFFSLLSLVENELLISSIVILLLEFLDSILGHLSLNIFAFSLTGVSMILEHLAVNVKLICKKI